MRCVDQRTRNMLGLYHWVRYQCFYSYILESSSNICWDEYFCTSPSLFCALKIIEIDQCSIEWPLNLLLVSLKFTIGSLLLEKAWMGLLAVHCMNGGECMVTADSSRPWYCNCDDSHVGKYCEVGKWTFMHPFPVMSTRFLSSCLLRWSEDTVPLIFISFFHNYVYPYQFVIIMVSISLLPGRIYRHMAMSV